MLKFIFLTVSIILTHPGTVYADVATLAEADSMLDNIEHLRIQGKYSEAAELANQRLVLVAGDPQLQPWRIRDAEILTKSLGAIANLPAALKRDLASADSLQNVLNEVANAMQCERGVEVAQRQFEIRERILGPKHPDLVLSIAEKAYFHFCLGNFEKTIELLDQKRELNKSIYGELHPNLP